MTRKTPFNGSAAGRRRQRRAALQSDASNSTELLHRPSPSLSLSRKTRPNTERAITPAGSEQLQLYRQKMLTYAMTFAPRTRPVRQSPPASAVITCQAREKRRKVPDSA
ncbi:hypothetical protein [Tatumella sp. JGM118]|uniref:transcriptional antitermination N peptide n=1 Tax=Tatumella sp. JGM118 TaxID=2799796 RepID=UPI001BAFF91B|nr:hypothetical protein [Tatumella sp. JGM118]MBS0908250.1 hypothetical protein [Tatumella sp. JGM118]